MIGKVVFDTSALVGAILKPGSVPYQALVRALSDFELCISKVWHSLKRSSLGGALQDTYPQRPATILSR
jgi:hypothetical protein